MPDVGSHPASATWKETFRLIGILLLVLVVGDLTAILFPDAPGWSTMRMLISLLVAWGLLVLIQRRRGALVLSHFRLAPPSLLFAAFVAGTALSLLGVSLMSRLPSPPPESMVALDEYMRSGWAFPRYAAMLIVAPVFEELFFRGWLMRTWESSHRKWVAILAAAIPFALLHLMSWRILLVFPLGLLFGWLSAGRSTIIASVGAHAGANLAPLTTAPVLLAAGFTSAEIDAMVAVPWSVPAGAAMVLVCCIVYIRLRQQPA